MWRPWFNPEGKKEESTETLKQLTNTYTYNGKNIYEGASLAVSALVIIDFSLGENAKECN